MQAGLVLGSVLAVSFALATYQATAALSWVVDVGAILLALSAARACRDRVEEGRMSFGAVWWYTIMLHLYSGMVAGVFKFAFLRFLRPGYLGEVLDQTGRLLAQSGASADAIAQTMAEAAELFTPGQFALCSIMGTVLTGAIIGLPIALIVKRN